MPVCRLILPGSRHDAPRPRSARCTISMHPACESINFATDPQSVHVFGAICTSHSSAPTLRWPAGCGAICRQSNALHSRLAIPCDSHQGARPDGGKWCANTNLQIFLHCSRVISVESHVTTMVGWSNGFARILRSAKTETVKTQRKPSIEAVC